MRPLLLVFGLLACLCPANGRAADLVFPGETIDRWHGHVRHRFLFEGKPAWVVEPETALPGNPWSWCMWSATSTTWYHPRRTASKTRPP